MNTGSIPGGQVERATNSAERSGDHQAAHSSHQAEHAPSVPVPATWDGGQRRATLLHRVEYLLFTGAVRLSGAFGESATARAAAALGRIAYRPLGIRRGDVETNLRVAFPKRGDDWIRSTAAACYEHLAREALALLRLSRLDPEELVARTEVVGLDAFRAALNKGRGIVVVTGHLGNWEIGGAALAARDIPIDGVAQRQANPLFDGAIARARQRLGMGLIDRRRASRLALRSLHAGRVVAFVADQNARGAGVFVPFFGRLASTHRGPALFALRADAPVFLGTALRLADGRYRVRLEAVPYPVRGERDDTLRQLTAAFTARLEHAVREAPEQYFWHHRRWKTRPPEEQAVPGLGTISGPPERFTGRPDR